MSVFALAEKPVSTQIAAIKRGLPSDALTQISRTLGLPKQRLVGALNLAQRTITQRERAGARFNPEESERLIRIVRVCSLAREVFSTDAAVAQWLNEGDPALEMRTPLQELETGLGAARVENLVRAMIHGVPT